MIETNIIRNLLEEAGAEIKTIFIQQYDKYGLRATGEYERQLEIITQKSKLILLGAAHSIYMEEGREPGGRPPIYKIREWLRLKPNLPSELKEKKGIEYGIANKMAEEGIKVPNEYNKGGIITESIKLSLKEYITVFLRQFRKLVIKDYQSMFLTLKK